MEAHPFSRAADRLADALADAADGVAHGVLLRWNGIDQSCLTSSFIRGKWWSGRYGKKEWDDRRNVQLLRRRCCPRCLSRRRGCLKVLEGKGQFIAVCVRVCVC